MRKCVECNVVVLIFFRIARGTAIPEGRQCTNILGVIVCEEAGLVGRYAPPSHLEECGEVPNADVTRERATVQPGNPTTTLCQATFRSDTHDARNIDELRSQGRVANADCEPSSPFSIWQEAQDALIAEIRRTAAEEARRHAEDRLQEWNEAKDQEIKEIIDRHGADSMRRRLVSLADL